MKRVRVRIRGRVQGVFFRAETRARAESLGIAGLVLNNLDGSVEAVFEGPADRVDSLVDWCRRGPSAAEVEEVEIVEEQPLGDVGFQVR